MWIFQRQQKRQCDQRAYALDLFQQRHLRIQVSMTVRVRVCTCEHGKGSAGAVAECARGIR
jgi:hypothetical protein